MAGIACLRAKATRVPSRTVDIYSHQSVTTIDIELRLMYNFRGVIEVITRYRSFVKRRAALGTQCHLAVEDRKRSHASRNVPLVVNSQFGGS